MHSLLFYFFLKPVSLLPLRILHLFSDCLFLLLFYVFQYRRKVVQKNLLNSFPEKSRSERAAIEKKFYYHLCDLIVESVKMFSITEKEAVRRCRVRNPEVLDGLYRNGQNVILTGGHYANWEMTSVALPVQQKHQIKCLYAPLKNEFWNKKVTDSRSRYGSELIDFRKVADFFRQPHGQPFLMGFITDQSPGFHKNKKLYWTTFLQQETAVALGAEKYAQLYGLPVVFIHIHKIKRGYYEVEIELLVENPKDYPPMDITERHVRALEKDILKRPEWWLWSHRRWKYGR